MPFAQVKIPNATDKQRTEAITSLAFVDGKVIVAGLSNEEFASTLRAIPYPFAEADKGAGIEIFHGAHGRLETHAPVRTFVPYKIGGADYILAVLHLHPAGQDPGVRPEGRGEGDGHDHRRAGQPQPAAGHDRLHQGRQGLRPDGQQRPRGDEDPGRPSSTRPSRSPPGRRARRPG